MFNISVNKGYLTRITQGINPRYQHKVHTEDNILCKVFICVKVNNTKRKKIVLV